MDSTVCAGDCLACGYRRSSEMWAGVARNVEGAGPGKVGRADHVRASLIGSFQRVASRDVGCGDEVGPSGASGLPDGARDLPRPWPGGAGEADQPRAEGNRSHGDGGPAPGAKVEDEPHQSPDDRSLGDGPEDPLGRGLLLGVAHSGLHTGDSGADRTADEHSLDGSVHDTAPIVRRRIMRLLGEDASVEQPRSSVPESG